MKKWVAVAAVTMAVPMASAKILVSVDGGLGYNVNSLADDSEIGGDDGVELASDNSSNGLNMDADNGFYGWLQISLPVLPDLKLKYENLKLAGSNNITRTFEYGSQTIELNGDVNSEIDLSHIDLALTYGIPLPMVDIDFGLNARSLLGGLTIDGDVGGTSEKVDVDFTFSDSDMPLIIPMGYVSVSGSIPTLDVKLSGELSTLPLGDTNVTDWNIKGTWYPPLPTSPVVKLGLEAGYRHFSMTIGDKVLGADTSDLASEFGVSSFFFGGTLHF